VFLGPHIGKCCYNVPEERANQFLSAYRNDTNIAKKRDGVWYLDIGYVNVLQLLAVGIPEENIEQSPFVHQVTGMNIFRTEKILNKHMVK